jgi:hypothetical protein
MGIAWSEERRRKQALTIKRRRREKLELASVGTGELPPPQRLDRMTWREKCPS